MCLRASCHLSQGQLKHKSMIIRVIRVGWNTFSARTRVNKREWELEVKERKLRTTVLENWSRLNFDENIRQSTRSVAESAYYLSRAKRYWEFQRSSAFIENSFLFDSTGYLGHEWIQLNIVHLSRSKLSFVKYRGRYTWRESTLEA